MKNLKISLSAFSFLAALVFFGCDNAVTEDQSPLKGPEMGLRLSTMTDDGKVLDTETATPNISKKSVNSNSRLATDLAVTGEFDTPSGNFYDFSAVMNSSGIRGEMVVDHTLAGRIESETICVSNVDNEAIFAVLLTSVETPVGALQENNIVFIKVVDNGEGKNNDPDQRSDILLIYIDWFNFYETPEDFLVDFPCSTVFDNPNFVGFTEIEEGQVQVR